MEDPDNECPICFEHYGTSPTVQVHCCKKTMHLNCYSRCVPMCPFCRAHQPPVLPVHIIVTDWPKVTKAITTSIMIGACFTIIVLQTTKCQL